MEGILELEQDSTTTLEGLIMDFSVDLLVFLATLTNIGVISCVIFRVTKFDSGVLLLLQLAVTDVIHDLHSKFFKVANVYATTWKYEPENISVWLQHNLYLGYSILLVSYFAILYTIFRELCTFGIISKNKNMFFEEFYTSYGMIWSLALLLCLNIILCGTDCDYFISIPEEQDILPRDFFRVQAFGIQCQIRDVKTWQSIFQVLTHPIWFPLFCLIFIPFLTISLIRRETKSSNDNNQNNYKNNHRILVILIVTYSALFFYDLIQFGTLEDNSLLNCTQAQNIKVFNQYGHQEIILQLTYVFQHWSRPFSAFIRNILCLSVILKKKKKVPISNHDFNTDLPPTSKIIPY